MKLKGSFDAKRLRPREPRNWGARLAAGLSALLATLGVLLAMAGVAGLLGNYPALQELNANKPLSSILTVAGLLLLWLGVRFWRRSRIRLRRGRELNLSPHLMKKHEEARTGCTPPHSRVNYAAYVEASCKTTIFPCSRPKCAA